MRTYYKELFSPGYIGRFLVKNRIVMAPMMVSYATPDGEVSETLLDYYEARARGGVGLIIVEAACVDTPVGRGGFRQLNIDSPRYMVGLQRLSQTIKAYGSRAFIQLAHAGRQTSPMFTGVQPVAPSPLACPIIKEIPRELTGEEIKKIEKKFVDAAQYAYRAGFDGVELHAAHGYLINQFLSSPSNRRKDDYGGCLWNRMRFLLNIVRGIKDSWPGQALSVRLNIDDFVPGGLTPEESVEICRRLENAGVDAIHCSSGTYESGLKSIEPVSYQEGWRAYLAGEVKQRVKIPVISGGMLSDPAFANRLLADRQADFVFLGRSLLADSAWAGKARAGRNEEIRPCIRCNNCIDNNMRGMMVDCTVNPATGREGRWGFYIKSPAAPAAAVVVGGGPAGMQAALSLNKQGLDVTLYEKDNRLGGLLNLACLPPYKHRLAMLLDYLIRQIKASGVEIRLNCSYGLDDLRNASPDYLVMATGSVPARPPVKGGNKDTCLDLGEVLEQRINIINKEVVVIGGGSNGCEAADFLLAGGNRITIVEENDILAAGMEKKNRRDLINRLDQGMVKKKTASKVIEIRKEELVLAGKNGATEVLEADYMVMAAGFVPCNGLYMEARKMHPNIHLIGDAFEVKGIKNAFLQGAAVGQIPGRL